MRRVWIDGSIQEPSEAFNSEGWISGEGIFETIRCEDFNIFALDRHMRRAISTGRALGIRIPSEEFVRRGVQEIIGEKPYELARLRLLFSNEKVAITYERYQEVEEPLTIGILNNFAQTIKHKTYPYTHRLEILDDAKKRGYGEVAIFNADSYLTEGAVSTLFFKDDKGWFTTPLSAGVLPGVMRALYIENLDIAVRPLFIDDVENLISAFAVSSLRLAHEIIQIGEKSLICDAESRAQGQKMRRVAKESSVVLGHV